MALMTRSRPAQPRRRGGRHARSTSFWRQLGWGRRTEVAPLPQSLVAAQAAPTTPPRATVAASDARLVVEALFGPSEPGIERPDSLYPLDWQYGYASATAQVAPALLPDAARNVVLAYADRMAAGFLQEEIGGRLRIRTARACAGVTVAVWADVTPDPTAEITPTAPADPESELPIEHLARAACLTTQAFDPVTDEAAAPGHPDSDPDGGAQETEPEGPSREPAEPRPTGAKAVAEDDTPLPADEQNQDTAA